MAVSLDDLDTLATRVRPVALPGEECLPVPAPLQSLLPHGALRRGSTVTVHGSTALALALVAAAEVGVALERVALVPEPGGQWATVAAALLDAVDVVLVAARGRVRPGDARRLAARARDRGAVLVPVTAWPEAADVRLGVASSTWEGLGEGHGRLRARRMEVVAQGRGAAARERRVSLWLPGADGRMAAVADEAPAAVERPLSVVAG